MTKHVIQCPRCGSESEMRGIISLDDETECDVCRKVFPLGKGYRVIE